MPWLAWVIMQYGRAAHGNGRAEQNGAQTTVGAIAATACGGEASAKDGIRSAEMQRDAVIGSAALADERRQRKASMGHSAASGLLGTFL
jgi:hypothetical protein